MFVAGEKTADFEMTIVVTIKINDGIVLASDSATSFFNDQGFPIKIYNNANKVFNLVKGLPIGGLTWGAGGIGAASISTITKDLRRRFSGDDPDHIDWKIDAENYTIEAVATKVREFFFDELYQTSHGAAPSPEYFMGYKVCGYSAGAPLPELWDLRIVGDQCPPPRLVRGQADFGQNWDGEYEAMNRLLLGVGVNFGQALIDNGLTKEQADEAAGKLIERLSVPVVLHAMPIQDAIDLAEFMVETTIKFVRFNLRHETVGGPIEVAAITKHEGFNWVKRKLFYSKDLNP
jgi:hypothetical protein